MLALVIVATAGATEVWTAQSLVNVWPDSEPGPEATEEIRLYAARGERESFQICIRGGKKGTEAVALHVDPIGEAIPPPEVRRVGYLAVEEPSGRSVGSMPLRPDPLLDFTPVDVPANQTVALWITYEIPRSTPPGVYHGTVTLEPGRGRKRFIAVAIEVFDFEIPEMPSLRALAPLDRDVIRRFYGIDDVSLDAWRPFYDALAKTHVSVSIWDGGGLVRMNQRDEADAEALKVHLEYAVDAMAMNTINLADASFGIASFPTPGVPLEQDPLQLYLHDMSNWLDERGWLDRAVSLPIGIRPRDQWQGLREGFFRVWRADRRVKRLMRGRLHPFFERYTDVWAIPLRSYHPTACARLVGGLSLAAQVPYPAETVHASSSGPDPRGGPAATAPVDGYDGCLYTAWCSDQPPSSSNRPWIEVRFKEPVRTDSMRIGWNSGMEAQTIRVQTSHRGDLFGDTSTKWTHHPVTVPFAQSWSEAEFKLVKTFIAVRIEFRESRTGGPVGVTELEFGRAPDPETVGRVDPVEIWLDPSGGDFPSLAADAHPVEPRAVPWVCWGHAFRGFTLELLNRWPNEWGTLVAEQPFLWNGGGTGKDFLFYPGIACPIPSVRVERLRDGIEDYEYLVALQAAVRANTVALPEAGQLLDAGLFHPETGPGELEGLAERISEVRVNIGRALGQRVGGDTP